MKIRIDQIDATATVRKAARSSDSGGADRGAARSSAPASDPWANVPPPDSEPF